MTLATDNLSFEVSSMAGGDEEEQEEEGVWLGRAERIQVGEA